MKPRRGVFACCVLVTVSFSTAQRLAAGQTPQPAGTSEPTTVQTISLASLIAEL